ncbi:aspartyl-tRNA(Asn)/glutamyl-tRNA(Gln) amidotransferase subunit A [Streptomyces sp. DvalAA-14]|uniref:amidase n=1 Tax=unclassified Streptomyces TaxID=2593676 RepID=UPI00081B835F|nr:MULTISPECIES: amidase [unclassified Streptomyces]MYS21847.1 amidase [Streptomyces sp. SID4948]SCE02298.1 aspartyl-tRNA(Asn)/glutamyl-tRNA(Gln) amidotransferase subunit A [Streptomyces sp. DvalAA-14]
MTIDLTYSDATELAELIRTRKVSSVEVVQAHLDRIEALNPRLNAVVTLADGSLEAARAADEELAAGGDVGPLHGVPFTAKDSFDTAGVLTQRASPIFAGRIPDTDATAVARIKRAGAILLAKTNLPEFSYWIETDNLLTGRTNNPWDLDRSPGGSSGGESASIATGMSPLGLASDLSISVRGPAADTGVVSFKPTHGRIPMTGIWPRAPRRNWHVGPMARSIRDLALAYSLLAGPDGADGFATAPREFDTGLGAAPNRPVRVGWLTDSGLGPTDPEVAATVQAAADALQSAGLPVDAVNIPALARDNSNDIWTKLSTMEMKPAFAEVTAGHEDQLFSYSKFLFGLPDTPVEDYVRAEQGIERLRDGFAEYFHQYDVLLLPVTTIPAHQHQLEEFTVNGKTVNAFHVQSTTVPFSLTGHPALSMRFGTSSDGMPIAVQVVANLHAESTVLHIASLLESLSPVRGQHPAL